MKTNSQVMNTFRQPSRRPAPEAGSNEGMRPNPEGMTGQFL
jgi:hypothetical protein